MTNYICEKCGGDGYIQAKGSGVKGFKLCPVCGGRGEVERIERPVIPTVKTPEPVVEEPKKTTRRRSKKKAEED